MQYLLINFKSRTSLINFSHMLSSNNIHNRTINTPHQLGSSCSLSLKLDTKYREKVIFLLQKTNLGGFVGLYFIDELNEFNQIRRIL